MSIVNDFTKEQLLSIINEELIASGSRIKATEIMKVDGHDYIIAKTNRNARLVIQPVCIYPRYTIGIRAIHRLINKHASFSYMPNGQEGRNLHCVVFNGESGKTYDVKEKETTEA